MRIAVKLEPEKRDYSIVISENEKEIISFLKKQEASSYAVVCDSVTEKLFGRKLKQLLVKKRMKTELFSFASGEESKNLRTVENILDKMLAKGIDRNSLVVALGGGVVGDLAGFVAASYLRGIPYVQVPTTLLAMVDSGLGGKVGVNLKHGKNSCGAFYQPKAMFANIAYLDSLPKKQIKNGLAECIKHGIIADKKLFLFIENNLDRIFSKKRSVLKKLVADNCRIKSRIVMKDEKEKGLRKTVNFGHTIGHAIESITNYRKYSHSEAIASGMYYEALLAQKLAGFSESETQRIRKLIERTGFRIKLAELRNKKLVELMKKDKKSVSGKINFSLPARIGKMFPAKGKYSVSVSPAMIWMVLEK